MSTDDDRSLSRMLLDDAADGRINPHLFGKLVEKIADAIDDEPAGDDQGDEPDSDQTAAAPKSARAKKGESA